jgi:uncharacterized protein (DUF342 family)
MADNQKATDECFCKIAIEMNLISPDKIERATIVQRCIEKRTNVSMPISKVLKEMGILTQEQIDTVTTIEQQAREADEGWNTDSAGLSVGEDNAPDITDIRGLEIEVSEDRLSAFLLPTGEPLANVTLETIKAYIEEHDIVEGVVDDEILSGYLSESPLPGEPFQIARGIPPINPKPYEIRYHFDIDPLRIGTLLEDGTMDWKNRGEIPEAKAGDLLAEKVGGAPGQPGRSVYGKDIPPPRAREPQLKNGKGAERNEDKTQIIAKVDGTPKLTSDKRITVFTLFPIEGDIGVDTGNIDFDGYIEVNGAVTSGYSVTAKGLRTREIQNATIELEEDLVSDSGIYGSTVKTGGNAKAGHIHNCTITVSGDLVVEKEIFGSTVEVNGRCLVESGKIIDCVIKAKKGIHAKDVGTEAAKPSELIVGIDHEYERKTAETKTRLTEIEEEKEELDASRIDIQSRLDKITTLIGQTAQEQEGFLVQKRQFETQLEGDDAIEDEEERDMLKDLISELVEQVNTIEKKVDAFMQQEDEIRTQLTDIDKSIKAAEEQHEAAKEKMAALDEELKADPGLPLVKISGTIYERTKIAGPHKKMVLSEKLQCVRIAESRSDTGGKHELTISNLR